MRQIIAVPSLVLLIGCGGGHDSLVLPTPTSFALTGQVVNAATASGIVGASVEITDGPNFGRVATTGGEGRYSLTGVSMGGFTLRARAQGYQENSQAVTLNTDKVINFGMTAVP
jgi:hypothetical protein